MKTHLSFITFIFIVNSYLVSGQAFRKGDHAISLGYGFGFINTDNDNIISTDIINQPSLIGPIYLKYENAVARNMCFGINLSYSSTIQNVVLGGTSLTPGPPTPYYTERITHSTYCAVARINWHWGDYEKFDPYAGIGLGCRDELDNFYHEPSLSAIMEATIGARYYPGDNFAFYAETGFSQSVIQIGTTYKFR